MASRKSKPTICPACGQIHALERKQLSDRILRLVALYQAGEEARRLEKVFGEALEIERRHNVFDGSPLAAILLKLRYSVGEAKAAIREALEGGAIETVGSVRYLILRLMQNG
jgi:hypothetical protein